MSNIKEIYKVESVYKAFYTGGDVVLSEDGESLFCQCGSQIKIINVDIGKVTGYIGDLSTQSFNDEVIEEDLIITFTLSPDGEYIAVSYRSGLLKLWSWKENILKKYWKSIHKGPVVKLAFTSDNEILATGGSDSSIRLWNLEHHSCTHNLQGIQGVVSVLKFHETESEKLLFGVGDDTTIKAWDISSGTIVKNLSGHYSKVTGIEISRSNQYIVSCSRDKIIILWDFVTGHQIKTIPLYESVESMVLLSRKFVVPGTSEKLKNGLFVAVGGENGYVRVWNVLTATEVFVQNNSIIKKTDDGTLSILKLIYNKILSSIIVVSYDHNLIFYNIYTFECIRQFCGFSDEILDIIYVGPKSAYIAVATNSADIKFYRIEDMNCQLLGGHKDIVLALTSSSSNKCIFASSSKDKSVRVWLLTDSNVSCIFIGTRHTGTVNAISLSHSSCNFLVSSGEDTTLKFWKLPNRFPKESQDLVHINADITKIAHEKDVNYISVSPNDKIIATASMDKTVKLWTSDELNLIGTLRGHKKSVWSCVFSPVDQVLLSTSADTTIKIWSLADLNCVKTFEGHDSSVLRGIFLSRGMQILTTGGDGLLKLWSVKSGECTASFDNHEGKVWALAVHSNETQVITGGTDSQLVIWRDVTEEEKLEKIKTTQQKILEEQELSNLLEKENYIEALKLALALDRPATSLKIIQDTLRINDDINELAERVHSLNSSEKEKLLQFSSHWNANSKHCYAAQVIISTLLDEVVAGKLSIPKVILESIIPYTERHFKRLTQCMQDLNLIDYANLKRKIVT